MTSRGPRRRGAVEWCGTFVIAGALATPLTAQTTPPPPPPAVSFAAVVASAKPDAPVTVTLANREIVVLRASVLGRSSADRAATAEMLLRQIAGAGGPAQVAIRSLDGAMSLSVDGRDVFAILPADVDALAGETLESKGQAASARLQQALDEMVEAGSPRLLASEAIEAAAATLLFALSLWGLRRASRSAKIWLADTTRQRVLVRRTGLTTYGRRAITVLMLALTGFAAYLWLTFVLRRFPYTRPWGDVIRRFLFDRVEWVALGVAHAMPGLLTVAIIAVATRLVARAVQPLFDAAEQGQLSIPGLYPETVAPTRKIFTTLLWLFALVVAYPFLPGSGTDAFKGISVFIGIVVSLGSSGIVNQLMSGLTITYSRALRVGDFVRIGDVEGTVVELGALSTKVQAPRGEGVTIPNTLLLAREVTNFSRNTDATDVLVPTSVTIGYDTPWRQIEALLLLAASRTPGVKNGSAPVVLQTGLNDFYVEYTLLITLDEPRKRAVTLSALRANIQDAFNEYGVQIMSPHYLGDPQAAKIVPKDGWSVPPARKPR